MKTIQIFLLTVFFGAMGFYVTAQDEVFKIVEQMPTYGDCSNNDFSRADRKACSDKSILSFIGENITYPDAAREAGAEGMVVLRFVVDEAGSVLDSKILKDVGHGCGEEALRVLGQMKKWNPGKNKGEAVKVIFTLPIRFKLQDFPVTIREERFEVLRHVFCENYMADFVKKDRLISMADDELNAENLCEIDGVANYIKALRLTWTSDEKDTVLESANGTFTTEMRNALRQAKVGDAYAFEYIMGISLDKETEHQQEVYKSVIVE